MRYSAPTVFTALNTSVERATIEPRPTDTSTACTAAPAAFPTTVASAALRPNATPRLITNSTLGPGTMMIAHAARANCTTA
jgi:hypothetical protein